MDFMSVVYYISRKPGGSVSVQNFFRKKIMYGLKVHSHQAFALVSPIVELCRWCYFIYIYSLHVNT